MNNRRRINIPVENDRRESNILATVLDTITVIIIINRGEEILYANDTFYQKTGYTNKDLETLKFGNLFTHKDRETFSSRALLRLEGKYESIPDMYEEVEIIKKDGKTLYCEIHPDVIWYKGKNATIYTSIDKTRYRKSEKAINQFFEYCPVSMYIKDEQSKFIKISKYYEKILKKPSLEVIGKTVHDIWPKDIADDMAENDKIVFEKKTSSISENKINGNTYMVTKFPINGDLLGGVSIDITEMIKAKEDIDNSRKKFKELYSVLESFLDSMDDMVWVNDSCKNIIFANKALRDFHLDEDILNSTECTMITDKVERFIKKYNINGNEIIVEIIKSPLLDDNKSVVGCSGIVKDITESVHQQNKIIRKLEKLEGETLQETRKAINNLNNTILSFNRKWKYSNDR